ncbi:hypothetical protein [Acinetobacter variabilis]|uniref:hypothetical protein n=1 Tax=Acinetobacter variabilis TaxID=70346 RepID=UPI003D77F8F0
MPQKFQFKGLIKQKKSYSGKKKKHTFKVQAMIHYKTQQILSLLRCYTVSHGSIETVHPRK